MSGTLGRLRYVLGLRRRPLTFAARLRMYRADLRHVFREGTEVCQDCGRGFVLWGATDALWQQVYGSSGGILCPLCFERRAAAKGISVRFTVAEWPRATSSGSAAQS